MANQAGAAYGLTVLSPIINGMEHGQTYGDITREWLRALPNGEKSFLAATPNVYLARFYVLDDVFDEGYPAKADRLKSRYLVFSANFYGDRDLFLQGMWRTAEHAVRRIWSHCVAFSDVQDEVSFVQYIEKCQINNALFFNGSTDVSRAEQLKSLYIKQEFSRFVFNHCNDSPEELQLLFAKFIKRVRPADLCGPTWKSGMEKDEGRDWSVVTPLSAASIEKRQEKAKKIGGAR